MNVYQKMHVVMQNVQYLSKDDNIEYGKNTKYKAISEEKVTTAVRTAMVEAGLVIFPVAQSRECIGQITAVDVQYRIQNIDDPDDYVLVVSSGDGADTQDKGAGKAMTYAFKYALLRAFAIPTGEDPDKISSAELDEMQKKRNAEEEARELKKEALKEKETHIKKLLMKIYKGDAKAAKKEFDEYQRGLVFESEEKLDKCLLVLEKRSLDANAYCWLLIDKIAAATGIPARDIYCDIVRDIGGNSYIIPIRLDAAERYMKIWQSNGLAWMCDNLGACKHTPGYVTIKCYYGSSVYDTGQMSRLIALVVQECKQLGIETLQPDKLGGTQGGME